MKNQELFERVERLISPILNRMGFELVDCKFFPIHGAQVLRLDVDGQNGNGVTIDDCAHVSRSVEDILTFELEIHGNFNIEVSSPGADRALRKIDDFKRFIGSVVKIRTVCPIEGRANYKGVLESCTGDVISVIVDNQRYDLKFCDIEEAHLQGTFEKK